MPSIKTARFLAFTEALLQVGHRYCGGVDTGMARVRRETRLSSSHRRLVFMKARRIHKPFHGNFEKTRHPRGCSEPILLGSSDIRLPGSKAQYTHGVILPVVNV